MNKKVYAILALLSITFALIVANAQTSSARISNPLSSAPSLSTTDGTATSSFVGGVTGATTGGNFGVGTTSPKDGKLVVENGTANAADLVVRSGQTTNQQARVRFFTNFTSDRGYVGWENNVSTRTGLHLWNADASNIVLGTNNIEVLRCTNAGEIACGVGTTTARAIFQVTSRNTNATTAIQFGKPGQNKGTCMTEYDAAGSPVYRYFAAGATSPTYQNGGTAPSGCIN